MKEYMKIGDYIKGSARVKFIGITSAVEYEAKSGELFMSDIHAALSHAINSHDELVAEVERLRLELQEKNYLIGSVGCAGKKST